MRWLGPGACAALVAVGLTLAACSPKRTLSAPGQIDAGGEGGAGSAAAGSGTGAANGEAGSGDAPSAGAAGLDGAGGATAGGAPGQGGGFVDGGTGGGAGEAGAAGGQAAPLELSFDGAFVRKLQQSGSGWLALLEHPQTTLDYSAPLRELRWLSAAGDTAHVHGSTSERAVLDFAQHPSGAITVLGSTDERYWLARFDAQGTLLGEAAIVDPLIDADPPTLPEGVVTPPIEPNSRDGARLAANGEDVVVGTRTGRHSVVAYRFHFDGVAFQQIFRTLVVPGHSLYPVGLIGGSYDTFGQLDAQYVPQVAVAENGVSFVATVHPYGPGDAHLDAHEKVFGERLQGDAEATDLYVTRLAPDGERLGTSVVGTPSLDDLYGMRAVGDTAYLAGRTEHWNEQGTGFDALVGTVAASDGAVLVRELDVSLSDLAFDAYPLPDGSLLIAGASGWGQNPHGASVTEASHAFLARVEPGGGAEALALPSSSRHDEARALVVLPAEELVVAGMLDGPGTHSADGDPELVRASGFIRQLSIDHE